MSLDSTVALQRGSAAAKIYTCTSFLFLVLSGAYTFADTVVMAMVFVVGLGALGVLQLMIPYLSWRGITDRALTFY